MASLLPRKDASGEGMGVGLWSCPAVRSGPTRSKQRVAGYSTSPVRRAGAALARRPSRASQRRTGMRPLLERRLS
jgi:hypothetical protein